MEILLTKVDYIFICKEKNCVKALINTQINKKTQVNAKTNFACIPIVFVVFYYE